MASLRPLWIGDLVVLDGDALDDVRAEHLVDLGFTFHEVARVSAVSTVAEGTVRVRLARGYGRPLAMRERELRRVR